MVITNLLRQGFVSASNVIRTNIAGKATHKRLLVKKCESWLLSERKFYGAYEGDGKTIGFIINKTDAQVLLLMGVTTQGFYLSNGAELIGSTIILPHSLMGWNVLNASEVSEESLTLFKILEPKIDILVFGYGSRSAYTPEIRQNFQKICKNLGLRYEALPTEDAIGLYNFLADERRLVAAALIPPASISPFRYDTDKISDLLEDLEEEEDQSLISDEKRNKKLLK